MSEAQAPLAKNFVTEKALEDRRKKRQEEWEKVRRPDQPLEAPEEQYDARSLYERLKEQRDKKQAEFEEAHRLKNMIRGLDDDEVQFLDLVDKTKEDMEAKILAEEGKEIEEYRKAVATLAEEAEGHKLQEIKSTAQSGSGTSGGIIASTPSQKRSQHAMLAGAVKRKSTEKSENSGAKRERTESENEYNGASADNDAISAPAEVKAAAEVQIEYQFQNSVTCLGVLPGLGVYSDSSESDVSSDSEPELSTAYDLLGRPRYHAEGAHHASSKASS